MRWTREVRRMKGRKRMDEDGRDKRSKEREGQMNEIKGQRGSRWMAGKDKMWEYTHG